VIDVQARAIPNPDTEPTIPVAKAAAVLGVGLRNAYDAIDRGEIPHIRVGRRLVVPTRKFLRMFDLLDEATDVAEAA